MYNFERSLEEYSESWGDDLIFQAARYTLLSGGKRVRPHLVMAACEAVGGNIGEVIPYACAMEMIHAASLIMDDIMDGDSERRGKPACHIKYGLGIALMASQFMSSEACLLMTNPRCLREALTTISDMCIGQAGEIADLKTGSLIKTSVRIGAIIGGAPEKELEALTTYGSTIGLLFQLRDDILDGDRPNEDLYVDLSYLNILGPRAAKLKEIAHFIVDRTS